MDKDRFKHRCTEDGCPLKGQITHKCGCHKTEAQMMAETIEALEAALLPFCVAAQALAGVESELIANGGGMSDDYEVGRIPENHLTASFKLQAGHFRNAYRAMRDAP